jgi:3-methylfumaryl-CoA hydratase
MSGSEVALVVRYQAMAGCGDTVAARSGPGVAVAGRDWPVTVDPVLLFRSSALTYNAHRIRYDREFARAEGYPGLVVHGPLQALLMAELARPLDPAEYSYRLVAPLYEDQGPDRVGRFGR